MAVPRKPPVVTSGLRGWLRQNLFSNTVNSIVTVLVGALLLWAVFGLLRWIFFEASWERVWVNLKLFAVFRFPDESLWRPMASLALILGLLGLTAGASRRLGDSPILMGVFRNLAYVVAGLSVLALLFWASVRLLWPLVLIAMVVGFLVGRSQSRLTRALPWLWALSFPLALFLLYGVRPGDGFLHVISAREWGGFMLTLILTTGLIPSFPIGIALALGRRSDLPAIKYFCIGFIEIVRGAPLIMWLFIASLLLPLLLDLSDPSRLPSVLRAYVAITLFSAAYMAENVRGGLQAVPGGQTEAARALGLSGWQTTSLIVLPQALRAVIPAIVCQAIGLFKDTSLVFVIGLADFFNVHNIIANQPDSLLVPGGIRLELSLFLAVVYWFFAFRMSVASRQLEQQLGVGVR
jgi:general L-amino acid transport system permease protein